jgi:hypothetical protein
MSWLRAIDMLKRIAGVALVMLLMTVDGFGQDRPVQNLRDLPERQRVKAVSYCRGAYDVALGDGSVRSFKEYDLAFKLDSSDHGPGPATPALVPTGRVGDRAFVVFANLDQLRTAVRAECRN